MRFHGWILAAALSACPALAAAQRHRTVAPAQQPLLDTSLTAGSPQSARDIELEYHIETQLSQVPSVDLSDVHARSVRGAVTLRGSVPNEEAHRRAIVAASGFFGVRVLRDELSVGPQAASGVSAARGGGPADAWLELQAQRAAASDASVGGPAPMAVARRGVVTMYGRVATFRAAHRLMREVQSIPGVKSVRMEVQVGEVGFIPARQDLAASRR